jgi:hypothetical protein
VALERNSTLGNSSKASVPNLDAADVIAIAIIPFIFIYACESSDF